MARQDEGKARLPLTGNKLPDVHDETACVFVLIGSEAFGALDWISHLERCFFPVLFGSGFG